VWWHEVPYVKSLKFGFFKAPMSMESLQKSSGIMMMERPAPVTALAPSYKLGTQLGGARKDKRATLYGGWFADGADTDSGDASQSSTRLIGRGTWLIRDASTEDSRLLHFGMSGSHMLTTGEGVRYRARPESYLAPYLVDTGNLGGDSAVGYGLESAWVAGPLTIQAEGLGSFADDAANNDLHFFGAYISAGWFLTGESRPYNRELGTFSTIEPLQNFSFKGRSWGALEVAGRFSYTDLSDGPVHGGEMAIYSAGINCYLTKRHRIMLDGGMADVSQRDTGNGTLYFLQTRLQLEF
jgi:phosphate-selective porin OprO/OprP